MIDRQKALVERMADAYPENPIIRSLIQVLVPLGLGGALDTALATVVENMRKKRLRAFFDELAAGSRLLTEDVIRQEEFLHAYFSTAKAAVQASHDEKAKQFAQFLLGATRVGQLGTDTFGEFFGILEDLSVREWQILLTLKRFEDNYPRQQLVGKEPQLENDLQRASRFWNSFEVAVEAEFGIADPVLRGMLTRLNRTGLYETFQGSYLDYTGGKGKLTALFGDFAKWLEAEHVGVK